MSLHEDYFNSLNYTLGNEDSLLENKIVAEVQSTSIFSIAGSGARALALLTNSVNHLTVLDMSMAQLYLSEMRLKTYEQLSYEDFIFFWNYIPSITVDDCEKRQKIFYALNISLPAKEFCERVFLARGFLALTYVGKWERTFSLLSKINRFFLRKSFWPLFSFDVLDDQKKYYKKIFFLWRFYFVLFLVGHKTLFNALLYKGHFVVKNKKESYFEFYQKAFHRLFHRGLARNSYFLHLVFWGEIRSKEGLPFEGTREAFDQIKNSHAQVDYVHSDVKTFFQSKKQQFDFVSYSDVPSYFADDEEKNFLQDLIPSLLPGALVVVRYYLRISNVDLDHFVDVSSRFSSYIDEERVQMYDVRVYQYQGEPS